MTINSYYNPSGSPSTGAAGASAVIRSEYANIAAGFALLPTLSGNGSTAVIINPSGTGMTVTTGTLALAGNFATTGAFNTTFAQTASVTLTLPAVSDTLATLGGTETLSNKTLIAPALGTPVSGVLTNCTGTAAGLTAGTVTTNANLNGPITSSGNTTSIASQTGTGTTFVMSTSPTLTTPVIGAATGTSLSVSGQLTSTVATGTAPLVVSSTTVVSNLNSSQLLGNTWAVPGTIGSTTPNSGAFTTGSFSSTLQVTGHVTVEGVTSTGATGTGNFVFSASPTFTGTLTAATTSFSGHMTIEGVTSTGATGTGAFVFATSPTLVTPNIGAATLGGTMTAGTNAITGGNYQGALGVVNALGSITGSNAINYNSGNYVTATQNNAAVTYTFTNWPTSGTYGFLEVITTLDATPHSVTFTGVTWDTNTGAPTLVASKKLVVVLETTDGGSTIRASLVGQF